MIYSAFDKNQHQDRVKDFNFKSSMRRTSKLYPLLKTKIHFIQKNTELTFNLWICISLKIVYDVIQWFS